MHPVDTAFETLQVLPKDTPPRPPSTRVLMADPFNFDVTYVINPHMAGQIGNVDRALAVRQWKALRDVYERIGLKVDVLPSVPGLPDLVFIANQSFPTHPQSGPPQVILSNMHSPQRRPEVPIVGRWFEERGWEVLRIADGATQFEGMGDANWHPGRRLIYGGFGFRTNRSAYLDRSDLVDAPIVALKLVDERLYHLDTCFCPLDEDTALICPEAFAPESLALLERCFPRLITAPLDESVDRLACNGHCPDEKHFIVQEGADRTNRAVGDAGFEVIEVDTSEFLKSGGSVQCLKLMLD